MAVFYAGSREKGLLGQAKCELAGGWDGGMVHEKERDYSIYRNPAGAGVLRGRIMF